MCRVVGQYATSLITFPNNIRVLQVFSKSCNVYSRELWAKWGQTYKLSDELTPLVGQHRPQEAFTGRHIGYILGFDLVLLPLSSGAARPNATSLYFLLKNKTTQRRLHCPLILHHQFPISDWGESGWAPNLSWRIVSFGEPVIGVGAVLESVPFTLWSILSTSYCGTLH